MLHAALEPIRQPLVKLLEAGRACGFWPARKPAVIWRRWMDNVFIERLWRSVKYECVYLHGSADLRTMEAELDKWCECYNRWRPHQALGNLTPDQYYRRALQRERERKEAARHVEAA